MRRIKVGVCTGRPGTRIAEHAGRTRYFLIYEIEEQADGGLRINSKNQVELAEDQILHEVLHRYPLDFTGHPLEDVEVILTRGIGQGALQKLSLLGKRTYLIEEKNPDEAIDKLMAGTLKAYYPQPHAHHHGGGGCGCHDNDHDCGCSH